jgi:glycosyltransferase involved in cell wall biosynthesis
MSHQNRKRKILILADSPTAPTGFSTVSRNILSELHKTGRYEIDMVGINYQGQFNRKEFEEVYPYLNRLVPAKHPTSDDMYGREYVMQILEGRIREMSPPWDIFFTIQDHFILEARSAQSGIGFSEFIQKMQKNTLMSPEQRKYHFMWAGYFPVDGQMKQNWVDGCIAKCTYPVAYCDFGKDQILQFATEENGLEERLKIIRHGTNTKDFFPQKEKKSELRKKYFKNLVTDDDYLIININRNQVRKDLVRTLMTFKEFKKKVPKAFLYLHCNPDDLGGNIFDIAKMIGLDAGEFAVPVSFNEHYGVPIETVNDLYACADAVITTTLGEGWGLSLTEAMATKTPILAPNITSIPEIFNTKNGFDFDEARGICFDAGKTLSETVCYGVHDNEVLRPISNVDDAVEKLVWVYEHPTKVQEIVERAYTWAKELTWENECKKWIDLFDEACRVNDLLREKGPVTGIAGNGLPVHASGEKSKVGRNDPCPICADQGVKIKVKKCKKHSKHFIK